MMSQMMFFMPIMFAWITLGLPSGLTLYWTVSNLLAVVQQYFVTGWGALGRLVPVPGQAGSSPRWRSGERGLEQPQLEHGRRDGKPAAPARQR